MSAPTQQRAVGLTLGLLLLTIAGIVRAAEKPLPVSAFFERPAFSSPSLSYDGTKLAFLTPSPNEFFVFNILDLKTLKSTTYDTRGEDIGEFAWLPWPGDLVQMSSKRGSAYSARITIFSAAEKKFLHNVTYDDLWFRILAPLKAKPFHYYAFFTSDRSTGFGTAERGLALIDASRRPTVGSSQNKARFNVVKWIALPPGEYRGAVCDDEGELRLVAMYRDESIRYHYRRNSTSPWKQLHLNADEGRDDIVAVDADSDTLYVAILPDDAPTHTLYRYDAATDTLKEPVLSHPKFSMAQARVLRLPTRHTVVGFRYSADRTATVWLDQTLLSIQQTVDAQLAGRHNVIVDWDDNLQHVVIGSDLDGNAPTRYFYYDGSTGKLSALEASWPHIPEGNRYRTRSFNYDARDGLSLQAYLTLPAPRTDGRKPPLVVLDHGGPWARDTGDFSPDVQLLASRGYAVLQPNYRGSTGFSRAVSVVPAFDFRAMHNDVTDATRALIASGLIDPTRIAIMGASFGGYLAACGVAWEPGLYKCSVALFGVYDWAKMTKFRSGNRYDSFNFEVLRKRLGDPAKSADNYRAISPIYDVAAIKVPVFVSYGGNDYVADEDQSKDFIGQLKKHNVPHEVLAFDSEGHGPSERENRIKLYEAIDRFLSHNL